MGDTTFFMGGIGYEWNNWLRFDVTGEYRSKAPVNFFGTYTFSGDTNIDSYQGFLQSVVFLANAYVDLGTWDCLTPFVGVGIGGAWNKFADLTDVGIPTAGSGIGRDSTNVSFAWALHAGLAYKVTQEFHGRVCLPLPQLRLCHRHHRLRRRLQPRFLQAPESELERLHAGHALALPDRHRDDLRAGAAGAVVVPPPAPVYTQPAAGLSAAPVYQPAPVYSPPPRPTRRRSRNIRCRLAANQRTIAMANGAGNRAVLLFGAAISAARSRRSNDARQRRWRAPAKLTLH